MAGRRWTPAENSRLRELQAAGKTWAEVGAEIGRTVGSAQMRGYLLRHVKPQSFGWSAEEDNRLIDLLERHYSYRKITKRLRRSYGAVCNRAAQLGVGIKTINGWTVLETARRLGVEWHAIGWWIDQGWLKAHRTDVKNFGVMRIVEEDDLLAFLENDEYWAVWKPSRIQDRRLRLWATELRAGVTFLTAREADDRLGVTHYAICKMIGQGRLRATKHGPNWRIRSDQCIYPAWLPRTRGRAITDEDRAYIRQHWGSVPATEIARRLGLKSDQIVLNAARQMGLPPVGRGYWRRQAAYREDVAG